MDLSFQTKIDSILPKTKNLEMYRSISMLMYKLLCIEIFTEFWKVYQQLTMGQLQTTTTSFVPIQITDEMDTKIYPKEILSFIKEHYNNENNQHEEEKDICLNLIQNCLSLLKEKNDEYRRELHLTTCSLSDYTSELEQMIENYVEQGLIYLRLEMNCHITLIRHYYIDEILRRQYLMQSPTDAQVNVSSPLF